MKKLIAIALSLCLMLTTFCAVAETANVINWADVEPQVTEAGWQGEFFTFAEIAMKLWIPSVMTSLELTDEDREAGYIGYFTTEDQSASVAVCYIDLGGMDLETYAGQLADVGATNVELGTLNGIPVVTYSVPENDSYNVAATTQAGYVLELVCAPMSDEGFASVVPFIMASIQAE